MPHMDGLEFCKKLKQNNDTQNIPIIMLSCKNKDVDIQEALEFGVNDYLVKPFRINKLMSIVKKLTK
ncbi:MAG: response regulator, partial [Bacteroidota bacterium]